VLFIINNNIVNKSSYFSDIVSKPKFNTIKELISTSIVISNETFPNLPQSYRIIKKKNNNNNNNKFVHKRDNHTSSERINFLTQDNIN